MIIQKIRYQELSTPRNLIRPVGSKDDTRLKHINEEKRNGKVDKMFSRRKTLPTIKIVLKVQLSPPLKVNCFNCFDQQLRLATLPILWLFMKLEVKWQLPKQNIARNINWP